MGRALCGRPEHKLFRWTPSIGGCGPSADCPICGTTMAMTTEGEIWSAGERMESYHWFLLGIMVAVTPSLLVLGVLLARSHDPADTNHSGE